MVKATKFEVIFVAVTRIKKGGIYAIPPFYQEAKKN